MYLEDRVTGFVKVGGIVLAYIMAIILSLGVMAAMVWVGVNVLRAMGVAI